MTSEIEERRISQRLKQINLAKNSVGYQRYTTAVRKNERKRELNLSWHPSTPDPYSNTSKSCFSGRLKEWKLRLHLWGNLDDLAFKYIIENNLKFPPRTIPNLDKTRIIEGVLDHDNANAKDSLLKFIKFSDLTISPISCPEKGSFTINNKSDKHQLLCALSSQINSIELSKEILLPKLIDCKKGHFITKYVTLFIPDNYRGIQVWKSSNFIRHCDITSAVGECYFKALEHGLSLLGFINRYNIDILGIKKCPGICLKDHMAISDPNERHNEFKTRGIPYRNGNRLTNSQKMIIHRSDRVVLSQNKLFSFKEQGIFRLPFIYHPSTVVYHKILGKLNKAC